MLAKNHYLENQREKNEIRIRTKKVKKLDKTRKKFEKKQNESKRISSKNSIVASTHGAIRYLKNLSGTLSLFIKVYKFLLKDGPLTENTGFGFKIKSWKTAAICRLKVSSKSFI